MQTTFFCQTCFWLESDKTPFSKKILLMAEQIYLQLSQFIDFRELTYCLVRLSIIAALLGLSRVRESDNLESF